MDNGTALQLNAMTLTPDLENPSEFVKHVLTHAGYRHRAVPDAELALGKAKAELAELRALAPWAFDADGIPKKGPPRLGGRMD